MTRISSAFVMVGLLLAASGSRADDQLYFELKSMDDFSSKPAARARVLRDVKKVDALLDRMAANPRSAAAVLGKGWRVITRQKEATSSSSPRPRGRYYFVSPKAGAVVDVWNQGGLLTMWSKARRSPSAITRAALGMTRALANKGLRRWTGGTNLPGLPSRFTFQPRRQ